MEISLHIAVATFDSYRLRGFVKGLITSQPQECLLIQKAFRLSCLKPHLYSLQNHHYYHPWNGPFSSSFFLLPESPPKKKHLEILISHLCFSYQQSFKLSPLCLCSVPSIPSREPQNGKHTSNDHALANTTLHGGQKRNKMIAHSPPARMGPIRGLFQCLPN